MGGPNSQCFAIDDSDHESGLRPPPRFDVSALPTLSKIEHQRFLPAQKRKNERQSTVATYRVGNLSLAINNESLHGESYLTNEILHDQKNGGQGAELKDLGAREVYHMSDEMDLVPACHSAGIPGTNLAYDGVILQGTHNDVILSVASGYEELNTTLLTMIAKNISYKTYISQQEQETIFPK